jgi:hypothetical protein
LVNDDRENGVPGWHRIGDQAGIAARAKKWPPESSQCWESSSWRSGGLQHPIAQPVFRQVSAIRPGLLIRVPMAADTGGVFYTVETAAVMNPDQDRTVGQGDGEFVELGRGVGTEASSAAKRAGANQVLNCGK